MWSVKVISQEIDNKLLFRWNVSIENKTVKCEIAS